MVDSHQSPVSSHQSGTGPGSPVPDPEAPSPKSYKVKVENFYGPLDLLLHLVKETEVDVTRVSLAQVASQYISFIEAMQKLDLDLAGDFLTVASQLLLIKSRTLVPSEEEEEELDEGDPSLELIRKLLEYKIYKDRARALGWMADDRSRRFGRPRMKLEGESPDEPLRDVDLWDLVVTWARVSKATKLSIAIDILYEAVPIEVFMERVISALKTKEHASFRDLVGDPKDTGAVIGTFLAVLELMKDQKLHADQSEDGRDIRLSLAEPKTVDEP